MAQSTGRDASASCVTRLDSDSLPPPERELELVCATTPGGNVTAIRDSLTDSTGSETVTFIGLDGADITGDVTSWRPGECPSLLIETGCLSDPAAADLTNIEKCRVDEVIVGGESSMLDPDLEPGWTVAQLVDAVNAVSPGTLSESGGSVVLANGQAVANLEIVCIETDFTEDFGTTPVPDFTMIPAGASTTYTYDGPGGQLLPPDVYAVGRVKDARADAFDMGEGAAGVDATGDTDGKVLMVNGSATPGEFYRQTITGLVQGQEYTFRAFVANGNAPFLQTDANSPDVTLQIQDAATLNVLATIDTGPVNFGGPIWREFNVNFVANVPNIEMALINNSGVIAGNDVLIDQVTFSRVDRTLIKMASRGALIPVEIVKQLNPDGSIDSVRAWSSDGQTEYTIPDPNGKVLSVGRCETLESAGANQSDDALPSDTFTTEPGCLSSPASADSAQFERCRVFQVILNGESIDIDLEPGWSTGQLVDAVNAARPGSLDQDNGSIVLMPGQALGTMELVCREQEFLEDFGVGGTDGNRVSTPNTNYTFQPSGAIADGFYAITSFQDTGLATWHTNEGSMTADSQGDANGNSMYIGADATPGEFYRQPVATTPNREYSVRFFVADTTINAATISPDVRVNIETPGGGTVLETFTTGIVPNRGQWQEYSFNFVSTLPNVEFVLINNGPGGFGNDLAIDEISFNAIDRQLIRFASRGQLTPVEIVKTFDLNGVLTDVRVFSSDGDTELTEPYENDAVLSTGPCFVQPDEGNAVETTEALTIVQGANNNVPAGLKSVTISNLTGVTTINGTFELGDDRRPDSISYGTNRTDGVIEELPAFTLAGGTWQWIGLQ